MTGPTNGQAPARSGRIAESRSAAMAMAGHGWPVLRATYREGGVWRGRSDTFGLRPVDHDWSAAATVRPAEVAHRWADEPYGVLVACGFGVDCIELPGPAGHRMLDPLREAGLRPPAMLTPTGRLVLFVRTPTAPSPFLVSVSVRSAGSWVAVPPTGQHDHGAGAPGYRWLVNASPARSGWELPEPAVVNEVITSTIRRFASVPRGDPLRRRL